MTVFVKETNNKFRNKCRSVKYRSVLFDVTFNDLVSGFLLTMTVSIENY